MPRRSSANPQPSPTVDANLATIAKELGVAVSTVSRALRNSPGIHPTTRLRIQTEAARLGYAVRKRAEINAEAEGGVRHLLTLAQSVDSASQQGYLAGISRAAQAHNIGVFSHHCSPKEAPELLSPGRQPAALRVPDLAGVIFIHRWPEEILARMASERAAVSLVHRYPGLPVDTVGTDDESGLRLLVRHFLAGGHRQIGFFGYEPSFSWARSRFAGYVGALAECELPHNPADVIGVSAEAAHHYIAPDISESVAAVRARIRAGTRAWIASSHVLGQALVSALRAEGLSLPGDVAVAGYHAGRRPFLGGPRLTTIEVDDEALGAAAVHLLNYRIERAVPPPTLLLIPGRLVQGDTTPAVAS